MMRRALALAVAAALFMTGCASRADKDSAEPADGGTSGGDADQKFGSLDSPCGKGTAKVAAAEAGGSPDTLRIGIANDRNSTFRPGLNSFFWDSANAFVKWCNDQGGVAGVPLEAVDVDGKVLEVEAAVAKSCSETFALVGGGWTQDNLAFSGKDGADFHKCKLIAFAGFAVSSDFAEANGQVQPVPNTAHEKPDGWLLELAKLYPEGAKHLAVMYGTLPAIEMVADQVVGVAEATKKFGKVTKISYDALRRTSPSSSRRSTRRMSTPSCSPTRTSTTPRYSRESARPIATCSYGSTRIPTKRLMSSQRHRSWST